jgi:hypothetical protein
MRNELREVGGGGKVGGENVGAEKGAEKSLGRGRGCVFGSSPKQLERPHPKLVRWWLLVHSSQGLPLGDLTPEDAIPISCLDIINKLSIFSCSLFGLEFNPSNCHELVLYLCLSMIIISGHLVKQCPPAHNERWMVRE